MNNNRISFDVRAETEEEAGEKARSLFKTMASEKFQRELKTIDGAQLLRRGDSFEKDEEEEGGLKF